MQDTVGKISPECCGITVRFTNMDSTNGPTSNGKPVSPESSKAADMLVQHKVEFLKEWLKSSEVWPCFFLSALLCLPSGLVQDTAELLMKSLVEKVQNMEHTITYSCMCWTIRHASEQSHANSISVMGI